ncbi:hypothetical protein AOLI_G00146560 [Acnodon oligacanthus]
MAKVWKAETPPPLNKTHKLKRLDWSKKYLKTDFSKVLWTDEIGVTLDGPDGCARGWISNGHRAPLRFRHQQGGGGVLPVKALKMEKLMTWASPDLNPIENLRAVLKWEIYSEGKQYTSLNIVWEAVVAAAQKLDRQQTKQLTDS